MNAHRPQSDAPALPMSTISHWLARLGIGPAAEPPGDEPLDGATIIAREADLRARRKEESRRAVKPPLPFS
jgi:hypothetical protein